MYSTCSGTVSPPSSVTVTVRRPPDRIPVAVRAAIDAATWNFNSRVIACRMRAVIASPNSRPIAWTSNSIARNAAASRTASQPSSLVSTSPKN
jgi:hypothetical protein